VFSPSLAHPLLWLIVIASIALMLIRPCDVPEVYWVGAGVLLLLSLRLIPLQVAGKAVGRGLDVYLFLIGMMLLSELAREQGVFDWLASAAVRNAQGSDARLFLLVYAVGAVVTVFMSNDATAVVLTPAILFAVRRAKVEPLPYLFVCAFIANAASFVLPISNPANLVIFHKNMPPLGRWLLWFTVPSIVSIVVTFFVLRCVFRRRLRGRITFELRNQALTPHGKLVVIALGATAIVLITASALNWDLGLPTCLTALAVTIFVCVKARTSPLPLARQISWTTIGLVAGLFVMVEAVERAGAIELARDWFRWADSIAPALGTLASGFAVGVSNNLVNNLPLGLLAGSALTVVHVKPLITASVLIGTDLGPNLSITGSLATILWLIALRREKLEVSFASFLKVGLIAMPIALLASLGGAIAMSRLFGAL
jgi:arsenical pump membrane protein